MFRWDLQTKAFRGRTGGRRAPQLHLLGVKQKKIYIYKNFRQRILLFFFYKVQRMVGFYALSIAKVSKFIVTPVG